MHSETSTRKALIIKVWDPPSLPRDQSKLSGRAEGDGHRTKGQAVTWGYKLGKQEAKNSLSHLLQTYLLLAMRVLCLHSRWRKMTRGGSASGRHQRGKKGCPTPAVQSDPALFSVPVFQMMCCISLSSSTKNSFSSSLCRALSYRPEALGQ